MDVMCYWYCERVWRWGWFSINLGRGNRLRSSVDKVLGVTESVSSSFVRGYEVSLFLGWG